MQVSRSLNGFPARPLARERFWVTRVMVGVCRSPRSARVVRRRPRFGTCRRLLPQVGNGPCLPPQALFFTRQWDYVLSPSWYFQEVEGLRRDVVVVSPQLLRHGWYVDELERRAPALFGLAAAEGATYRAALRPVEQHRPYDPSTVHALFLAFVDSLATRALRHRPVLCTPDELMED